MASLLLLLALLRVTGDATCPAPAEVAALLPDSDDHAEVSAQPEGLRVRLLDNRDVLIAERVLHARGSCADLALAVATLLTAWQRELGVRRLPRLRLPHAPRQAELDLGVAFSAALAGTSFAPSGTLSLFAAPRGGRVGGRVALFGEAPHAQPFGPGEVRYGRAGLALGPAVRFRPSRLLIDLHAEAVVALVVLQSRGFSTTARALDVDPALGGGIRLAVRLGRVAPFIDLSAYGFLRRQVAVVAGVAGTAELPRVEALLSIGLTGLLAR